jgi:hypothetical protein
LAKPVVQEFIGGEELAGCVPTGLLTGALSALMTLVVSTAEGALARLPIHSMWCTREP